MFAIKLQQWFEFLWSAEKMRAEKEEGDCACFVSSSQSVLEEQEVAAQLSII